jgi:hypothetical protein
MSIRLLVATVHHLLAIDPEQRRMWRVHSGSGLYYGLASGPGGLLYAACRNTVLWPAPGVVDGRATEHGSVLVFDREFQICDELRPDFAMRDLHGIACYDDRLWVTCTFDSFIAIHNLRTGRWDRWYPCPDESDHDVLHLNTVCFVTDGVWLVAHRFGPSELMLFGFPGLQLQSKIQLGTMAHNVFLFKESLATCSSGDGYLVNCDGKRLNTGNFPRGVARTEHGNLLGISLSIPRDQRAISDAVLRWYDTDWRFRLDFLLRGVGMVLEILELESIFNWNHLEPWLNFEVSTNELLSI